MKIALCIEYPLSQHGGTEVLVKELVHGLSANHSVILVSPDDDASLARSGVQHQVFKHIPWTTEPATPARARILAEKLVELRPDVVHFHFGGNYAWKNRAFGKCPVLAVHQAGLTVLSTNHGAFSIFEGYCWEKRPFWVKLLLFLPAWFSKQHVLASLRTEVAVSQNDYRALRRWYFPLRDKFRWIYHSRIRETQPPPPNADRRKVILCAGTIGPRKGQPFLVAAFARLAARFPDWQLLLIGRDGDPTMSQEIRDTIAREKLENRILLPGPCSDEELREHLKTVAIFAMPSLFEGLGLSLQEAQFYGCACIGTRCGGVTDLIKDDDNGLLINAGEVEPLVHALERLMSDAALRERLSRRAPQSVLEKDMIAGKMVEHYERLYANLAR